jgi:transcription elongation factor Elf1
MNANVKRCPFCNGHNLTMDRTESISQIRCFDCGAMGPSAYPSDVKAVRYWNDGYQNPSALVANRKSNRADLKNVDLG